MIHRFFLHPILPRRPRIFYNIYQSIRTQGVRQSRINSTDYQLKSRHEPDEPYLIALLTLTTNSSSSSLMGNIPIIALKMAAMPGFGYVTGI
jgi:hypothetical protein